LGGFTKICHYIPISAKIGQKHNTHYTQTNKQISRVSLVRNAFNISQEKTILTDNAETTKLTLYAQRTSFAGHTIFGISAQEISKRARIVRHCV
jgi:hypothetical protein